MTRRVKYLALFILLGFPIYLPLRSLLAGAIPHWYDMAWGLLLGLENHQKLRLIGYEGGIPGIFYGPHWSWMISVVQLFDRNPAVVATIVLFIPYFTLLPWLFFKFKTIFGTLTTACLWLLYILAYHSRSMHLWHIYAAPLILLALIYVLVTIDWNKLHKKGLVKLSVAGFLTSLLLNIHMSLGSIITLAVLVYVGTNAIWSLVTPSFRNRSGKTKPLFGLILFGLGFLLCSLPFILFELRHNFMQTKRITYVLTQSFLYNSAVVGQVGLSQNQIWWEFGKLPLTIFQIPDVYAYVWWLVSVFIAGFLLGKGKLVLTPLQKRLVFFLGICALFLIFVYLSSKNPIWEYQFVGADIIVVLLIGLVVSRSRILTLLTVGWTVWLSFSLLFKTVTEKPLDPLSLPTLYAKRYVVEQIYQDADKHPFTVYSYSPAIYTFDYDYLFKWLGKDVYKYEPELDTDLVYLIIPEATEKIKTEFVGAKTPDAQFVTQREWQIKNDTVVIKRARRN